MLPSGLVRRLGNGSKHLGRPSSDLAPAVITYGTAINTRAKTDLRQQAFSLSSKDAEDCRAPAVIDIDAAISAGAKSGQWQ
jgi:hypothetical protein